MLLLWILPDEDSVIDRFVEHVGGGGQMDNKSRPVEVQSLNRADIFTRFPAGGCLW
jgi:hypothetical protein